MTDWLNKPWFQESAEAVRILANEMITKAKSGHPGAPLGMAEMVTVLWNYFLNHNPQHPAFINRDRFVLSNGHASAMLYAALHLSGYDLTIDDLKRFRQFNSKTPGHPEYGLTCGVEVSTGPLGQGVANAVGLALAERTLAAQFNRPDFPLIDHFTYLFAGDGCLMEGVAYEALSLAGTQKLDKLIMFWDSNGISIDGSVSGWFDEDVAGRFRAMHWRALEADGHSPAELYQAIFKARNERTGEPTLIICHTTIGKGTKRAGSSSVHGSPLKEEELVELKHNLHWSYPAWEVPSSVYNFWDAKKSGAALENVWHELFEDYAKRYPELAKEFTRRLEGALPDNFAEISAQLLAIAKDDWKESLATRQLSQMVLEHYQKYLPELLGGSADLTSSNLTNSAVSLDITSDTCGGNYLHYGTREFAMFAIMNGMALHGGFLPFAGTFLVFVQYGISAIRMAALMRQRSIYVLTHDSIGVGEDGPTHQPVEHLWMLRGMPNLEIWRPASGLETAVAWQSAIQRTDGPTALVLSRQKIAPLDKIAEVDTDSDEIAKGGYILWRSDTQSDTSKELVLIATGSEVFLALHVARILANEHNLRLRVVSMPSLEKFEQQDASYKQKVLPQELQRRVVIEAGSSQGWYRYVSADQGLIIGIDEFGKSAPSSDLFDYFGFTIEKVVRSILNWF